MPEGRLVQLVEVVISEGEGVAEDPVRRVVYYFWPDGTLAARRDQWEEEGKRGD